MWLSCFGVCVDRLSHRKSLRQQRVCCSAASKLRARGFRVWGLGCRFGSGFRVQGSGFGV